MAKGRNLFVSEAPRQTVGSSSLLHIEYRQTFPRGFSGGGVNLNSVPSSDKIKNEFSVILLSEMANSLTSDFTAPPPFTLLLAYYSLITLIQSELLYILLNKTCIKPKRMRWTGYAARNNEMRHNHSTSVG